MRLKFKKSDTKLNVSELAHVRCGFYRLKNGKLETTEFLIRHHLYQTAVIYPGKKDFHKKHPLESNNNVVSMHNVIVFDAGLWEDMDIESFMPLHAGRRLVGKHYSYIKMPRDKLKKFCSKVWIPWYKGELCLAKQEINIPIGLRTPPITLDTFRDEATLDDRLDYSVTSSCFNLSVD